MICNNNKTDTVAQIQLQFYIICLVSSYLSRKTKSSVGAKISDLRLPLYSQRPPGIHQAFNIQKAC
jgi:hypothetical protein